MRTGNFVDGDWMRTGDVAYLDDEGYLFVVDRIKDLVIRGGENIGCGEVEAALLEHPSIQEVSVYAVPDALGERLEPPSLPLKNRTTRVKPILIRKDREIQDSKIPSSRG